MTNMLGKQIQKDENILPRFMELAMRSPEFKKEQDDQNLEDDESDGGYESESEEENKENFHPAPSYSPREIKEDENIILRLHESFPDPVRGSVREDDLTDRQILPDKESNGGFKQKGEEENQENLHENASHSPDDIAYFILQSNRLFMEPVRQFLADTKRSQSDLEFENIIEEKKKDLHEDTPHSRYIKKNEDIILRLNELFMESVLEFETQYRRSLTEKKLHGRLKSKIEEENQEDLEDASHSRYDIKEGEDIIRQLNESFMESVREFVNATAKFKKEQNDLQEDLNAHQSQDRRSLAEKQSHGGFEHKIEEENREDASVSPFGKEDEDIIFWFNQMTMEPNLASLNTADKFKKEQNGWIGDLKGRERLADKENDGGSNHKIEEDKAPINKNLDDAVTFRITEFLEVRTENLNPLDMTLENLNALHMALDHLDVLEEIGLKFCKFMDHTFSTLRNVLKVKHKHKEQDKFDFLDNIRLLLLRAFQKMDIITDDLERMKKVESREENSYTRMFQIPEDDLFREVEINANVIKRSFLHTITFLFDDNCRRKELLSCVDLLNQSMENLKAVLLRIRSKKWQLLSKDSDSLRN